MLEFEARCLLARDQRKDSSASDSETDDETVRCPQLIAQRALGEDLLGPAGSKFHSTKSNDAGLLLQNVSHDGGNSSAEMLFSTALDSADKETVTWVAKAMLKLLHTREVPFMLGTCSPLQIVDEKC